MIYFVAGILALILGLMFLNWLANTKPRKAVKGAALAFMVLCVGLAVLFMVTGRWGLTLPSFAGAWVAFQRYRMAKGIWSSFKGFQGGHGGDSNRASKGNMTESEALEILGLEKGASVKEIKNAHKELMLKVHPDKGGTPYLASQLNEAKDTLLKS